MDFSFFDLDFQCPPRSCSLSERFLASFLLWFGSSAELACLLSLACLCRDATLGLSREWLLWWVELDSSCLSLEKTLGLRPGRVLLDMVSGLGLRLFLVLLFLSHDSDSES
ncbi:hypothetical protein Tco_0773126 [Tanacetum coccineum]|uniref:Uncharacterized protein n=1 Tax=Tanacetum coccineum TaxID=301880 RepID=A0ABQ4ZNC4_9ASTR